MKHTTLLKLSTITLFTLAVGYTTVSTASNMTIPSAATRDQQPPAVKNRVESEAFLAANKTKPGVITLADGLQYKIITEGKGAKPKETDTVVVHYAGRLVDGTEFDSSYKRGEPTTFPVNAVIPGWVEALQLMPVGSTWELYIPSALAYGPQGASPAIGPNQALIFKVQLLAVK